MMLTDKGLQDFNYKQAKPQAQADGSDEKYCLSALKCADGKDIDFELS